MATSQDFVNWVCSERIDWRFLRAVLLADRASLLSFATGTTHQTIYFPEVKAFHVCLPSMQEQASIGGLIQSLDDKIDVNRRIAGTLEEIARALFTSWFVDFDPVRGTTAMPEYVGRLFPNRLVDSSIGLMPRGWEIAALGEHVENVRDQVDPRRIVGDTPHIGLEHMPRGHIALGEWGTASGLESGKSAFRKGDVLFGKLRPYFHKVGVAPLDGICSTDILVLRPRAPSWAAWTLLIASSGAFVGRADATSTGTRMPRASWKDMSAFPVAVPPPDLLDVFQGVVGPMLSLINATVHENRTLAALRDSFLPELVSGRVRVGAMVTPGTESRSP